MSKHDKQEAIIIENHEAEPETLVIYAEDLNGDSLYGTYGYKPRTTEDAIEILIDQFGMSKEQAEARAELITAQEAAERGISSFCTLSDQQEESIYTTCPVCGSLLAASDFVDAADEDGEIDNDLIACPDCGYVFDN